MVVILALDERGVLPGSIMAGVILIRACRSETSFDGRLAQNPHQFNNVQTYAIVTTHFIRRELELASVAAESSGAPEMPVADNADRSRDADPASLDDEA